MAKRDPEAATERARLEALEAAHLHICAAIAAAERDEAPGPFSRDFSEQFLGGHKREQAE